MNGNWIYSATFQSHNGTVDDNGTPTYEQQSDWGDAIIDWPCELLTKGGGEGVRGRQMEATTTHLLRGEYYGAAGAAATMRVNVSGRLFDITAAYDPDGLKQELWVELKLES